MLWLVVEAVLAGLAVLVRYDVTSEYGDVTELAVEGGRSGSSSGVGGLALGLVVAVALVVVSLWPQRWVQVTAVAVPVLMVGAMLALTPGSTCGTSSRPSTTTHRSACPRTSRVRPSADAVRRSQEAFESLDHVGHFSGGSGSGVGGCDRSFLLLDDVQVLQHSRSALPRAGWRVVAADTRQLRAEREGMAFELVACKDDAVVWSGPSRSAAGRAAHRCTDLPHRSSRRPGLRSGALADGSTTFAGWP